MGILLVLCAVIFYLWRLFVFAGAFNSNTKKQHYESAENLEKQGGIDQKTVGKYSIHHNIYD